MILFTVLFTLEGRSPAQNQYVYMLMLLLKTLQLSGTYHAGKDTLYLMVDADTEALMRDMNLEVLGDFTCIRIPRPKTLLEGISRRYEFFRHVYEPETTTMYLDLDMLCCRQFRPELPADTMAVYPEGAAEDPNYCGTDGWAKLDHPGLSAGFWVVRIGPKTAALMERILALISEHPGDFYSVEQPHFNAAITREAPVICLKPGLVSFNATEDEVGNAHFINFAGGPGDGAHHFLKVLRSYLLMI